MRREAVTLSEDPVAYSAGTGDSAVQLVSFRNLRNGVLTGREIACATTALSRLVGLLRHKHLRAGEGLWINPSHGVHTFGMKFAIDVVALDKNLRVLQTWGRVKSNRVTGISLKVRRVLELSAGEILRLDIRTGDQMEWVPHAGTEE